MSGREKVAVLMAEFIGTCTLASVVLAMIGRTTFPFFAAIAAGSVLGLMTLVFAKDSGVHLNPAVTIGLWAQRQIQTTVAIVFIAAQMLGGLIALTLNEYLLGSSLKSIAGDKFELRVLVAEAIGTFIFTLGLSAAVAQGYQGLKKAFTIGGSLSVGIILAAYAGNGLLNPAVALGVQSWNIAYVTGPIVGALVGMSLYSLVFAPRTLKQRAKAAVVAKTKAVKKTVKKTTKTVTKKKR